MTAPLVLYTTDGRFSNVGPALVMPFIVGLKRARELLYMGDPIDAKTALAWGMINRVVSRAELAAATMKLARRMALISPESLMATKLAINRGADAAGFRNAIRAGLDVLAPLYAARTEVGMKFDEPGGGRRGRLREPNGYQVEVVHGISRVPEVSVPRQPMNSGAEPLRRAGELMRLRKSPAPIKRIGHGVMGTPKVRETVQWFRETLGFICSDDVYAGDKDNIIGSFNRCDCGDEFVDHHTLFCVRNERAGLNHMSFEVPDVDAVFMDHEYLARLGKYEHMWGVGRHLLGSQVYDYWCDPWGRVHERWADTDRLNARSGSNLLPAEAALRSEERR